MLTNAELVLLYSYKNLFSTSTATYEKYIESRVLTKSSSLTTMRYATNSETVAMTGMLIAVLSEMSEFSVLLIPSPYFLTL